MHLADDLIHTGEEIKHERENADIIDQKQLKAC